MMKHQGTLRKLDTTFVENEFHKNDKNTFEDNIFLPFYNKKYIRNAL